ncbi:MAG: transposase, partial [Chloroflexota bacterium]
MAPLRATVYELARLRCNLCGTVHGAEPPAGVGTEKYDATAASMIGLLKYGTGMPFHRLAKLEQSLGIPLAAATQWEVVQKAEPALAPAYAELVCQAAQGDVLHNDDTTMTILELASERKEAEAEEEELEGTRTGIFTSGIVSIGEGRRIALFMTGQQHAGENLADVLAHRAAALSAPIQMCDALSRNTTGVFKTIVAHCIAHARRRYVEVAGHFPDECRYVLETLGEVYRTDARSRAAGLTADERLARHQAESGPRMKALEDWM